MFPIPTTSSHLKNEYHQIEKIFNDSLSSPSGVKFYESKINSILDGLEIFEVSSWVGVKFVRVVNLSKKHIYINKIYNTMKWNLNQGFIETYTPVMLHITVHPGGKKGIISTPDLKVINLDATSSGTKGVSAAMKAFVTNE
jgi:hypothetical protein